MFGFSRGAATVRAFAGLIEACGLLDIERCGAVGARNREQIISAMLDEARSAYRKHKDERKLSVQTVADKFKASQAVQDDIHAPGGDLKIKFIGRSEEHTSELQSRRNLVCRLLLEKKKP